MATQRQKVFTAVASVLVLLVSGCGATTNASLEEANHVNSLPPVPWEGGPEYWAKFPNAEHWMNPSFFPIGLWYGAVSDASEVNYDKAAGINFYSGGLWEKTDFSLLVENGMYWVGGRVNNDFDAASPYWPGVFLDDEVDGRFVPEDGFAHLDKLKTELGSDRQFLYANFTNMIVGPDLLDADRSRYVNDFADVVSLDMYFYTVPFCDWGPDYRGHLYDVRIPEETCRTSSSYGRFVSALRDLDAEDGDLIPVWNFVELMSGAGEEKTFVRYMEPEEIKGAVMSSLINEARGIVWFPQSFAGPCQTSQPLRNAQRDGRAFCGFEQVEAMTEINHQVQELAPVLNTQSLQWVAADDAQTMLKVVGDSAYLFAMTDGGVGTRTFELPTGLGETATVLNEARTVSINGGRLVDEFAAESTYHVYQIPFA